MVVGEPGDASGVGGVTMTLSDGRTVDLSPAGVVRVTGRNNVDWVQFEIPARVESSGARFMRCPLVRRH
ncbi:hypothetical protein JOD54_002157 [Actinokineospora baliensis]|nr:hypothetical protein [Actinokineospora baliensis]